MRSSSVAFSFSSCPEEPMQTIFAFRHICAISLQQISVMLGLEPNSLSNLVPRTPSFRPLKSAMLHLKKNPTKSAILDIES